MSSATPAELCYRRPIWTPGSLPRAVAMRLEGEYEAEQRCLAGQISGDARREARYEAQKRHFARVETLLDQARHRPAVDRRRDPLPGAARHPP